MTLAGIFFKYDYRKAKGIVEKLLKELNINYTPHTEDKTGFSPNGRIIFKTNRLAIGELGILENGYIYYEFPLNALIGAARPERTIKPVPKHPAQIEDVTFSFPPKTRIGEVFDTIKENSKIIVRVELKDVYQNSYTFKIWYQHPDKTLTNAEVEQIRSRLLIEIKRKYGGAVKS